MGTFTNTTEFTRAGEAPALSVGGKRRITFYGKVTGSTSYATGGDTLTVPTVTGGTLESVFVSAVGTTRFWSWDGSTSTPKLKAVTATATEVTNTTNVSADVLYVQLVYTLP